MGLVVSKFCCCIRHWSAWFESQVHFCTASSHGHPGRQPAMAPVAPVGDLGRAPSSGLLQSWLL